ncbi:hypothetical protein V6Z12_A02G174700 [Gossypium hirsutum]
MYLGLESSFLLLSFSFDSSLCLIEVVRSGARTVSWLLGLLTFNKRKGAGIEHLMLKKGTKLWLDR